MLNELRRTEAASDPIDALLDDRALAFKLEIRSFLNERLTPEMKRASLRSIGVFSGYDLAIKWQRILHDKGWLAFQWPSEHGGPGWSRLQQFLFQKECARAGAPELPGMGLKLVGPVIYTFGSDAQKARWLPRLLSGEDFWAQGFSEPGAGSDLASLKTRAVREEGGWRLNGSKMWTTMAQHANRMFCLVRTDPDVKPQAGISFLLVDMNQPGVEVRPIISASGEHEVNQVFLEGAWVPDEGLIGTEGQGWTIAKFLLENERGGSSCFGPALVASFERLLASASERARWQDPVFRDRFARAQIEASALEWTELRILLADKEDQEATNLSLTKKLIASEVRQKHDLLASEIFGYDGLQLVWPDGGGIRNVTDIGDADAQPAAARYINSMAWSIFGGASEVQLNIIARAVLDS